MTRSRGPRLPSADVRVQGSGPTVLLIMGQGAPGRVWHLHQVPTLVAAGYRVITYDHPGAGPEGPRYEFGEAVDQAAWLLEGPPGDARELAPAAVVGTSLGSRIAAALAARHPRLVACAALCGAHACAPPHPEPPAGGWTARSVAELNLSPKTLAEPRLRDDWLAIIEMSLRDGTRLLGRPPEDHIGPWDLGSEFARITAPTLVMTYADDRMVPPWMTAEVAGLISGSRPVILDEAGHWGYLEQPAAFNRILLDFLAEFLPAA